MMIRFEHILLQLEAIGIGHKIVLLDRPLPDNNGQQGIS